MSTPCLAVLTNDPHQVFQRSVIAGTREVASERGIEVAVSEIPQPSRDLGSLPLERGAVAGALVIANVLPDSVLSALLGTGVPLTLVSHRVAGAAVPSVMHDNRQGMALLMEHLVLGCGRRRLAFIEGNMTQTDGVQREAAFRQELMRYNLEVPEDRFLPGDFEPLRASKVLQDFLSRAPEIDAIVSADYLMAIAAQEVLRQAGREPPRDISVVGFGDGPEAAEVGLTTVAADVVELGRRGARQLIGQLDGLRIRGETLLSTELVKRQSSC